MTYNLLKRFCTILLFSFLAIGMSFAQSEPGMNYQALYRGAEGMPLTEQDIAVRFIIRSGSESGPVAFEETHLVNTGNTGVVNLIIGQGISSDDLMDINWAADSYFLDVAVDLEGGTNYETQSISPFLSVPYALHTEAVINDETEDDDADPLNEINQDLSLNGTTLSLTDAGGTVSADLTDLASASIDNDATNELNTNLSLNGTILELTDAGGTLTLDLASIQDGVEDGDADPTNELQTISKEGNVVTLSNGGGSFIDENSEYVAGEGVTITDGVITASGEDCDLEIGDTHAGGIIFYIDPSGCHGLVCAPFDQSDSIRWDNNVGNVFTEARLREYFQGAENTLRIVNTYEANNDHPDYQPYAGLLVSELTLNGYDDWYIPSYDELNLMFTYLHLQGLGNFEASEYWTSTENNAFSTFAQEFSTGNRGQKGRYFFLGVRAIRAF